MKTFHVPGITVSRDTFSSPGRNPSVTREEIREKRIENSALISFYLLSALQSEPCKRLNWVVPRESPPVPWLDGSFVYKSESREERIENSEEEFA